MVSVVSCQWTGGIKMNQLSIYEQTGYARMFSELFGGNEKMSTYSCQVFRYLKCPSCGKRKAFLFVPDKKNTYLLKCHHDKCILQKSVTLNTAINQYALSLLPDWNRALGKNCQWGGIKNKNSRGKSLKDVNECSFKSRMDSNATHVQVKMMMEIQKMDNERFKTFSRHPKSCHQDADDKYIEKLMAYFKVDSIEKLPKLLKNHGYPSDDDLRRMNQ